MSLCACGCGELAFQAPYNDAGNGWVKGQFTKFAKGHRWRKPRDKRVGAYIWIYAPNCSRTNAKGWAYEHHVVAEQILGRPLLREEVVHHRDENKHNNSPQNLLVLPNEKAHRLEHAHMRIIASGGNPSTDKICCRCKMLKSKSEFTTNPTTWDGVATICRPCTNSARRKKAA